MALAVDGSAELRGAGLWGAGGEARRGGRGDRELWDGVVVVLALREAKEVR